VRARTPAAGRGGGDEGEATTAVEGSAMRGRRPAGPEYVEQLQGSQVARQRLRVILETLAGQCRVTEACQQLGISEPRFHQLRAEVLQAALDSLEPRPAGRRPAATEPPTAQQAEALQARLVALEAELQAARLREEIALILPNVVHANESKKVSSRRRRKPRRSPPATA
jgi:hypothetical protein